MKGQNCDPALDTDINAVYSYSNKEEGYVPS